MTSLGACVQVRQQAGAIRRALSVKDIRYIWFSQSLNELGDWAGRLALAIIVFNRTDSAFWSAAVFAVSMLPYVLSPPLTAVAMRWSQRSVMLTVDFIRMLFFVILAIPDLSVGVTLTLVFFAALASPPYEACAVSVLAEASGSKNMGGAMTLVDMTQQASTVLGYAMAGLLLSAFHPSVVLLINAATFGASLLLLVPIKAGRAPGRRQSVRTVLSGPLRKLTGVRIIRQAILLAASGAFVDAVVISVLPALAIGEDLPVWLLSALTLLSPLVGIVAIMFVRTSGTSEQLLRASTYFIVIPCAISTAFFLLAYAFQSVALLPLLVAAIVAYGFTFAAGPPIYVLVLNLLTDEERAPSTALIQPVFMGVQVAGAFLAGAIGSFIPILITQAAGVFIGLAYGLWVYLVPSTAPPLPIEPKTTSEPAAEHS